LSDYADLDEYALLHQAALWARGELIAADSERRPGEGFVTRDVASAWESILLRRPRWRAEAEVRAEYEPNAFPSTLVDGLGQAQDGRVAIDLAIVDARPADATATDSLLAIEARDGTAELRLSEALKRLPAYALIGRRYRRTEPPA
jgi:hypothetical protein